MENSPGPLFDDGKAEGAMRTIGEVSSAFGIKAHVLRYWEQQFPSLQPLKRSGGRRLYRAEDVAMVETINRLVNQEGYTLKGAKKAIAAGASGAISQLAETATTVAPPVAETTGSPPPEVTQQLRAIRDRLAAALD
ncbi:MerR family transcriptional regulator [Aurantiacibacter sp. D1-12]|uniref:MerR family transcriptional regulator n=1 Tax=Aurantiacibacter sp. D1-12 TaxID=2993658 RepID=UPI00237CFC7F|nr:MerR family transcriptional regulator [Aurantiacibacter sp. D1-12]MDE1466382.1 MerR family transcriptional regulator [Aurantiacibacter sp. D1-12]